MFIRDLILFLYLSSRSRRAVAQTSLWRNRTSLSVLLLFLLGENSSRWTSLRPWRGHVGGVRKRRGERERRGWLPVLRNSRNWTRSLVRSRNRHTPETHMERKIRSFHCHPGEMWENLTRKPGCMEVKVQTIDKQLKVTILMLTGSMSKHKQAFRTRSQFSDWVFSATESPFAFNPVLLAILIDLLMFNRFAVLACARPPQILERLVLCGSPRLCILNNQKIIPVSSCRCFRAEIWHTSQPGLPRWFQLQEHGRLSGLRSTAPEGYSTPLPKAAAAGEQQQLKPLRHDKLSSFNPLILQDQCSQQFKSKSISPLVVLM